MQWLEAVRGLAAARVAARRRAWAQGGGDIHAAIDEILATRLAADPVPEADQARQAIAADARWSRLIGALGLDADDIEHLAVVCACELDPRLTRVLGYLDDTAMGAAPTPSAAAALWGWAPTRRPGPASAVATWQLAGPQGDWQSTTPWTMDAEIAAFLAGADDWIALRGEVRRADPGAHACLHPALLAEMAEAVRALPSGVVELVGRPGSGRRTMLAQLAHALGRTPVLIASGAGARGIRAARLLDAVGIVAAGPGEIVASDADGLTFVACETPPQETGHALRLRWELPDPTTAQRRELWAAASALDPPDALTEWPHTPAEIAAAARAPEAAESLLGGRLRTGSLATMQRLALPYSWDDLVVADHVDEALLRLLAQVRLRDEVLDDWEFRRLVPSTAGVTALFAGPSGTGKTMATQVLARELGLELFRVDLATVVSKYIGETEKQLAAVFDEAERSRICPVRRGGRAVRSAHRRTGRPRPLREHRDRLPAAAAGHVQRGRGARDQPQERPRRGVPAAAAQRHRLRRAGARRTAAPVALGAASDGPRTACGSPRTSTTSGSRPTSSSRGRRSRPSPSARLSTRDRRAGSSRSTRCWRPPDASSASAAPCCA